MRVNTVAFGHIATRLTAAKEEGAFATAPDGSRVPLGIPRAQREAAGEAAYVDIPLRRPGTATEAAGVILAVASPLCSYVSGQTVMVSFLFFFFSSDGFPLFVFGSGKRGRKGGSGVLSGRKFRN